jgi:hypothetical protein
MSGGRSRTERQLITGREPQITVTSYRLAGSGSQQFVDSKQQKRSSSGLSNMTVVASAMPPYPHMS